MKALAVLLIAALMPLTTPARTETEVTVQSAPGISLAGTLASPEGTPKAALVLITGSGQQNRDEELFGKKPFRTISDALTDAGYAVLRLDDRGCGESTGDYAAALNADFVTDIACALDSMHRRFPDMAVGVLGHSEGGITAIKLGAASRCDFMVTLAAPAWAGDSIIMNQSRAIAMAALGAWPQEALQRRLLDIAKGPMPTVIAQSMIVGALSEAAGEGAAAAPGVAEQFAASAKALTSPWYRDMLRYDPAADIAAVAVPWLALNGSRDIQVAPGNLDTIRKHNAGADTVLLDEHNHLFQHAVSGMPDEYATLEGDISAETISAITTWLDKKIPATR